MNGRIPEVDHIAASDIIQVLSDSLSRLVPPSDFQQLLICMVIKPPPNEAGRIASNDDTWRNITRDNRSCALQRTRPDRLYSQESLTERHIYIGSATWDLPQLVSQHS
jgi:hypothetical protein